MSYVRIFIGSIVLFFCSCSNQHPTVPDNVYGPTIDIRKEQLVYGSSSDVLELKSYSTTAYWEQDSCKRIIAYNHFRHSLDFIDLTGEKVVTSVDLQREGPHGVVGKVCSICPMSEDSIWIYDGIKMYLLNNKGQINAELEFDKKEAVIIRTNFAMNTAKFRYNKDHNSFLYLRSRDKQWLIEEYGIMQRKVINSYPLEHSIYNPNGDKKYANMEAPNVNFSPLGIVYNYPYESTVYVLDTLSGNTRKYGGKSGYTLECASELETTVDYSKWEQHGITNPHYNDVMYLSELKLYVRPHLGETSLESGKSIRELGDGRQLYLMFFDEKFNVIGEFPMAKNTYSYFTGWCALPESLLLFVDNSLNENTNYENLIIELFCPLKS